MLYIRDIYAGKPDAKDEIAVSGDDLFFQSFIAPLNIDVNSLLNGDKYFITGFKGVGKTALLYYLEKKVKERDTSSCTSFIFFKSDYPDHRREELERLSHRLTSLISVDPKLTLDGTDYEYIWRWILFRQIISDQAKFSDGLFVINNAWESFVKCIKQIKVNSSRPKRFSFPTSLKFSVPMKDASAQTEIAPEFELDLSRIGATQTEAYSQFCMILDSAEQLLMEAERTDVPYYLFIDELEAYYGEHEVFIRDLKLIRDLVLTVNRINRMVAQNKLLNTHIICSVRTEIVNSIHRFITSKEMNKAISGFEVPLKWNYHNTNSYRHPIIQMLIQRIKIAENEHGIEMSESERLEKWFPSSINKQAVFSYILNNSWCKPRDIVRLILSAQNNLSASNTSFNEATFDQLRKTYSTDSLTEIKEEMLALYLPAEIESIVGCLTGFKYLFSFEEIRNRAIRIAPDSLLAQKTMEVLQDLYRLGVIGNFDRDTSRYRWHHKGDDKLIISDEWEIMIHQALQATLSIGRASKKKRNIGP